MLLFKIPLIRTKQVNRMNQISKANDKPVFIIRATPIKDGEILYDRHGLASAIKTKGQILAILEGEE